MKKMKLLEWIVAGETQKLGFKVRKRLTKCGPTDSSCAGYTNYYTLNLPAFQLAKSQQLILEMIWQPATAKSVC